MEYRKFGEKIYIRMDKGDEILSNILAVCKKEQILSAVFSGIGGCGEAEIQTFIPEKQAFETRTIQGMLELVSLNGNIIADDQEEIYLHAHGMFAYKEGERHCVSGGHLKSATVLLTGEIELRSVMGGTILRKPNSETGTGFWDFK